jgi:hypothetical protein
VPMPLMLWTASELLSLGFHPLVLIPAVQKMLSLRAFPLSHDLLTVTPPHGPGPGQAPGRVVRRRAAATAHRTAETTAHHDCAHTTARHGPRRPHAMIAHARPHAMIAHTRPHAMTRDDRTP